MIEFISQRWAPRLLSVLRIVTAFLFMAHGAQKLLGFPAAMTSPPALFSLIGLAGALELVGGALLLVGLFTRPVAFILCGEMAFAYFMAHAGPGLLAPAQPRRAGRALLLRVPLSRRSGRRTLEPRPCRALAQVSTGNC